MATRSMIAFDNGEELYAIYCHHDGYLEHNGKLLLKYWADIEKVEELMDLGNLSYLSKEIGEKQDFDQPTDRNWCLAYGRDRGEKNQEAQTFHSLFYAENHFDGCDYFYVFDGKEWSFKKNGAKYYSSLREAVKEPT